MCGCALASALDGNAKAPADPRPGDLAGPRHSQRNCSAKPTAAGSRRSDVAARAQVLVEQLVVAVDVGLRPWAAASCPGSPPRPCPACPCVELVELLPDGAAALAGRQRRSRQDRRDAVAVCTAGKDATPAAAARHFNLVDIVRATACLPLLPVSLPAVTNHNAATISTV